MNDDGSGVLDQGLEAGAGRDRALFSGPLPARTSRSRRPSRPDGRDRRHGASTAPAMHAARRRRVRRQRRRRRRATWRRAPRRRGIAPSADVDRPLRHPCRPGLGGAVRRAGRRPARSPSSASGARPRCDGSCSPTGLARVVGWTDRARRRRSTPASDDVVHRTADQRGRAGRPGRPAARRRRPCGPPSCARRSARSATAPATQQVVPLPAPARRRAGRPGASTGSTQVTFGERRVLGRRPVARADRRRRRRRSPSRPRPSAAGTVLVRVRAAAFVDGRSQRHPRRCEAATP